MGWRTLIIWECETKSPDRIASRLSRFLISRTRDRLRR
jgi:G:T-mismatch repair DNA endonuclease (very short patch repair protein)